MVVVDGDVVGDEDDDEMGCDDVDDVEARRFVVATAGNDEDVANEKVKVEIDEVFGREYVSRVMEEVEIDVVVVAVEVVVEGVVDPVGNYAMVGVGRNGRESDDLWGRYGRPAQLGPYARAGEDARNEITACVWSWCFCLMEG